MHSASSNVAWGQLD